MQIIALRRKSTVIFHTFWTGIESQKYGQPTIFSACYAGVTCLGRVGFNR